MARLMNYYLVHQTSIQKLIHLCVMGENQALLTESAPVANADGITGRGVNPRGLRQVDSLAYVHAQSAEPLPSPLQANSVNLGLVTRSKIKNCIQHLGERSAQPDFYVLETGDALQNVCQTFVK